MRTNLKVLLLMMLFGFLPGRLWADESYRVLFELNQTVVFPVISDPSQELWVSVQPQVETAMGVLRSKRVLGQVAGELGLEKFPSKKAEEEFLEWLRKSMSVTRVSDRLIEVEVRLPENQEIDVKFQSSERIAKVVVDSYVALERERVLTHMKLCLYELEMEAKVEEKLMEEARVVYLSLLKDLNLTDIAPAGELEIETPLMRSARAGAVVDEKVAEELLDEMRRMIEAQVVKEVYLLHLGNMRQLREKISKAMIAVKLPMNLITVHD